MSMYEYTPDALGRVELDTPRGLRPESRLRRASRSGQADRNELASAKRYTGGTLENPTNPVYSRHFTYDYDPTLDMPRTLRVPERLCRAARQGQVGNRETYEVSQGTATTYTANELNQYTQTADPSESFTHDDDGNLTQDGSYTYVWDAENRLIEIRPTSPGTNAIKFVYDYDYMGRRARRTQYGWTGSAWSTSIADQRIYLYDRWNNLIIYDADNGMAIGRKLTWGLDLSGLNGGAARSPVDPNRDREGAVIPGMHAAGGIGGLVAAWAPASPAKQYFCFYDANGNLSDCVKNTDGTPWSHVEYDPYGGPIVASDAGGLAHQFRYSTKFYQAAFATYDFGAHYFRPALGRLIARDVRDEVVNVHAYDWALYVLPTHIAIQRDQFTDSASMDGEEGLRFSSLATSAPYPMPSSISIYVLQQTTQPTTRPATWSNDPDCCKTKQYDRWGWVECCKGAPTICLGKLGLKYVHPVQQCLLLHEGSHRSDLPAGYCQCKKNGFWAGSDFSNADRQTTECKAFRAEKACLESVNCNDMPTAKERGLCRSQRADRLGYINRYLKKHCK